MLTRQLTLLSNIGIWVLKLEWKLVRQTIVFGNGLGRAIDNSFFSLEAALRSAWDEEELLTLRQKELIRACLPIDVIDDEGAPTSEDELEDLQRIVSACDEIANVERKMGEQEGAWLSPVGAEFPTAIRIYLHRAASYFLDREHLRQSELPDEFSVALRRHIMDNGANIVTLNYDDLLYGCFTDTSVFQHHRLRDGFFHGRFDIETHRRLMKRDVKREGWFLHLHGSPLFLTTDQGPQKLTRPQLRNYGGIDSTHLVLTNVKYKASMIDASEILSEYWKCFAACCAQSEDILILGYGGGDSHLNREIATAPAGCRIRIVQRTCEERDLESLTRYWSERFSDRPLDIVVCESILDFRDF